MLTIIDGINRIMSEFVIMTLSSSKLIYWHAINRIFLSKRIVIFLSDKTL